MENIVKGWFTSIIGMFVMSYSVWDWFIQDVMTWQEALASFIIGFILMWMRDKVSEWIGEAWQVLLDKFKNISLFQKNNSNNK